MIFFSSAAGGGSGTLGFLSPTTDFGFDDNFLGSGGGGGIDWNSVINQGFGIGSQIIGAWGRNPTQQIGAGGSPIGGGYSPAAINTSQAQIQQAIASQQAALQQQRQLTGSGGVGLDDAASSITGFITRNPLLVAGGVLGLFLLMREPPRRR